MDICVQLYHVFWLTDQEVETQVTTSNDTTFDFTSTKGELGHGLIAIPLVRLRIKTRQRKVQRLSWGQIRSQVTSVVVEEVWNPSVTEIWVIRERLWKDAKDAKNASGIETKSGAVRIPLLNGSWNLLKYAIRDSDVKF